MQIVVKSRAVLGDYVCLHGLVPGNELPKKLRGKIPKNQIWIRKDIWDDRIKRGLTLKHEKVELERMASGSTYKVAHKWAEMADGFW